MSHSSRSLKCIFFYAFSLLDSGAVQRYDPTYEATKLHFEDLAQRYGQPIIILNLIKVCDCDLILAELPSSFVSDDSGAVPFNFEMTQMILVDNTDNRSLPQ
jgi:hypothetical protein